MAEPRARRRSIPWGLACGLAGLAVGCGAQGDGGDVVRIASPHRDEIKYEFERGFRTFYHETTGRDAAVVWLDLGGGTSAIFRYLKHFEKNPGSSGVDIVFGGGVAPYLDLADRGFFEPVRLPEALLEKIPPDLAGVPLYDPKHRWYGATLSSFGIVFNKVICQREGLPVPRTWRDLADPRLAGWVMCGDPRLSGVVHIVYEIILQAHGWQDGWRVLVQIAANSRGFTRGSGEPVRNVMTGEAAVATCIDFYALGAIAREGAEKIGYVAPEGATPVSPDSIAVLRGAENLAVARRFVEFVMSEAGQCLWVLKRGTPQGPDRYPLGRLTAMPHLYTDRAQDLASPANPFTVKSYMDFDAKRGGARWKIVNDLYGSAIMQAHDELVAAWRAVVGADRPADLVARLGAPPCAEVELPKLAEQCKTMRRRVRLMGQWQADARRRYDDVRRAALERPAAGNGERRVSARRLPTPTGG